MAALAVSVVSVNAIVLDFDALANTAMSFSGNSSFGFTTNSSGDQFQITGSSTGLSTGLEGYVANVDNFTIGTITGSGMLEEAPVTGTATLYILDGTGADLTATLQWNDIYTFGAAGGINYMGSVNLTDIQYSGMNADLLALAAAGSASDAVSFQFASPMTLTELASMPATTSYSGSISTGVITVPEPAWVAILLAGMACFYGVLRCRRADISRKVCALKVKDRYR